MCIAIPDLLHSASTCVQELALMEGRRQESYSIEQFEENHSNIDETLGDLKNIVMKYLPETCDTVLRNDVLYRIYRLEEDLA